ncbi:MAG: TIGR01440 family protein [Oscillospiraceae bacterium]|jgi:uncharacterized protein (TIGR01440 family)|nr:TIGR01440 family protein [Oscillospiraceae bacterium]MCI1990327.1 TIGR01440 family protein [Oscillospiraceae bacterium]MCI2034606.1 TIGR01440 family protein [Oscillospiraceae bacterium]
MYEEIAEQAKTAVEELLQVAGLKAGGLFVVGCSSSEIGGHKIGSDSNVEAANAVFGAIYPVLKARGIYLAAQCCEHLNRALIVEREAAEKHRIPIVNVVPQPKAGGSFATAAYHAFEHPAAVEELSAQAGIDIGDTLIGMHLQPVAVPVRVSLRKIGEANLVCARTRPKFIGGGRAHYDEQMM